MDTVAVIVVALVEGADGVVQGGQCILAVRALDQNRGPEFGEGAADSGRLRR
jgi:hypothetical protein